MSYSLKSLFLIFGFFVFIVNSSNNFGLISKRNLERHDGFISIEFCVVTQNELLISPIELGTPGQQMSLVIDIGSERTWISNELFSKDKSSSYKTENYPEKKNQDNYSYRGIWSKDDFVLDNKKLPNFDFLLVDKIDNNDLYQGVLSLGREYDSKKFSLVYKLSSNSITFYNTFVLKFIDNNKGELYIGDLTNELKDYSNLMQSCQLITTKDKIKWACELTHVFVGDYGEDTYTDQYTNEKGYIISSKSSKITNINQPATFETIYNKIYAPKDFMQYLKQNLFFDPKTGSEICKYNEETSTIHFTCTKAEMDKVPNINFVFSNKLALTLPKSVLFDCNGDVCNFIVEYRDIHPNWVMGLPILKTYQMIFDYNKNDLIFYGENKSYVQMPSNKGSSLSTFFFYLFIFVVVLVITGVGVIYFLRRKNKKRKMIEEEIYENF